MTPDENRECVLRDQIIELAKAWHGRKGGRSYGAMGPISRALVDSIEELKLVEARIVSVDAAEITAGECEVAAVRDYKYFGPRCETHRIDGEIFTSVAPGQACTHPHRRGHQHGDAGMSEPR